ncbi:glutamate mutase L [Halarcobacter bivalviorum]|uniref:GlmL/MutL family protein n=1 Tax=Halarcobacter bivalviorum TaxID=663364 RepID=A0AAX2A9N3_9BACT|nr:glutamate mutase L [Halarcobacter bivalviorum]AXH12439.1 GlmL/MutL family protein [Halarcobacter bivalviorum]RXK10635.1 methylaspartate mutase [Halarcobacter bivalviorum]
MSKLENKLLIDVGSTYFKLCTKDSVQQHFRDFNKDIYDDLTYKCGEIIKNYEKENIHICSSANGGLSTLIIGISNSFSLKYATNIAFNSGINIIDTVLYKDIETTSIPSDLIDVVIVVGGIDSVSNIFDEKLFKFLKELNYSNIVYVGSKKDAPYLQKNIENLVILPNIINDKLHVEEENLKEYLTNLYQADIMGKEDIKHLYDITSNQIFSTPYIVNKTLPMIDSKFKVADPYILIDIGGATTDIHYSKDLVDENMVTQNEYDRLVFKKLGVYKSKESLIFAAKNNEFVYELLAHLKVTENIFDESSEKSTRVLMQLAIFLVLCKVSAYRQAYVNLKLLALNSVVFTGGITKVLKQEEIEDIVTFFYKKILNSSHNPTIVMDNNYDVWTLGMLEK